MAITIATRLLHDYNVGNTSMLTPAVALRRGADGRLRPEGGRECRANHDRRND
jgi:hypothetical protein